MHEIRLYRDQLAEIELLRKRLTFVTNERNQHMDAHNVMSDRFQVHSDKQKAHIEALQQNAYALTDELDNQLAASKARSEMIKELQHEVQILRNTLQHANGRIKELLANNAADYNERGREVDRLEERVEAQQKHIMSFIDQRRAFLNILSPAVEALEGVWSDK
jgi:chromosome segregation ATPase